MRIIFAFLLSAAFFAGHYAMAAERTHLAQAKSDRVCEQVISCGLKDGKWKEYPTPCAAADDGATNVKPKTGSSCGGAEK
jgi:hypothetical protein